MVVFGTRPEFIKLAILIHELKKDDEVVVTIVNTGQHREMLDAVIEFFGIHVDIKLSCMTNNQELFSLSSKLIDSLGVCIKERRPDVIVVQGDTATTFCAALAGFYLKVPICHVEAGLRTYDTQSPYPEEFNRQAVSKVADKHFPPTKQSKENLIREGVKDDKIHITGNTVIDAILYAKNKVCDVSLFDAIGLDVPHDKRIVLITMHRRESFGSGVEDVIKSLVSLSSSYPEVLFLFPVHLNPSVNIPVKKALSGINNISLLPPLDYVSFCVLMEKSYLILTDSGGVQEEAPSFGKPVLVMRDTTERSEGVDAGVARIVGACKKNIIKGVGDLLDNDELYLSMVKRDNPYGDGLASIRIAAEIKSSY